MGVLGTVLLGSDRSPAITVDSVRARRRRATWGADLFETHTRPVADLMPLEADPGLAAYLGGWA